MDARRRKILTGILAAWMPLSLAACVEDGPVVTVPEGTSIAVSLYATVRTDRLSPGERLLAKVDEVVVADGVAALQAGDLVALEVLEPGAPEDDLRPHLRLELVALEYPNGRIGISTQTVDLAGRPAGLEDRPGPAGSDRPGVLLAGQRLRFETDAPFAVPIPR